ncbi:hypothetical protein IV203_007247 [Nitzschia inconspicua]|uniref:Uncharacterized protein n=1 Tax=Nitzschia inconspicua TaxID=303405 RepID=A0A9K3KEG4_9STRA|nr:hypothetical protein IV203_007247 [Nitzschia inconspicua]
MVMLPCNVAYDPDTNRSYIYTKKMIEEKKMTGEFLFLDVPNDVAHYRMCTDYFPMNFVESKLMEFEEGEEGVYSIEYGENPLCSKEEGKVMILSGNYHFILREISPARDKGLYKLLVDNFLHANKDPWYPDDASILVMVPYMDEHSTAKEFWYSIGSPLDRPKSFSQDGVDAWILRAIERDGYYGLEGSVKRALEQIEQSGATTKCTKRAKTLTQPVFPETLPSKF